MILLRLRNRVVLPTIWLDRREWQYRFARDPDELIRVLNGSVNTVIQDLGGFGGIVRQARWCPSTEKRCVRCGEVKSVLEFYSAGTASGSRGECATCTKAMAMEWEKGERASLLR